MQHFKDGVEKLLRRLVGTWDFVLYGGDLKDKSSIQHRYVIQGLSYEQENIITFGYDLSDQTPLHVFFSPTTIRENDYLFSMGNRDDSDQTPTFTVYNFNQREGNFIRGVFTICSLGPPLTIVTGDFFAYREDKSAQKDQDARDNAPPDEAQERHDGTNLQPLPIRDEEVRSDWTAMEAYERHKEEEERDYYMGKCGVDIDAPENVDDPGQTMGGDEWYDPDNEHDTSMDYGMDEDIFDEEE